MRFLYAVSSAFLLMLFMDFLEEVTGLALSDTLSYCITLAWCAGMVSERIRR